jgi:hypothetical protein
MEISSVYDSNCVCYCSNCFCAGCIKVRTSSPNTIVDRDKITKEEQQAILEKKVIRAIMLVRERTGMNLRDAKALVDRFK